MHHDNLVFCACLRRTRRPNSHLKADTSLKYLPYVLCHVLLGLLDVKKPILACILAPCFVGSVIDFRVLHNGR